MKLQWYPLLGLLLLAAGAAYGAWIPVTSTLPGQPCEVTMSAEGSNAWQIGITVSGLTTDAAHTGGSTLDQLQLAGEPADENATELPAISRLIGLRYDGDPLLEVVSEEWTDLDGTYNLSAEDPGSVARDGYGPESHYLLTPRQIMGGVGLAALRVQAVQYNSAQHKVRVLRSVTLRVQETGTVVGHSRPITESTAEQLRAVLPNWGDMGLDDIVVRGTYLYIVSKDTLAQNGIKDLITWRKRQGRSVEVAGPAQIGATLTTTNVKAYIQARYNAANPPLEYVCLVGDANGTYIIPGYTYSLEGNSGVGDYDFARLDGTDLMPDINIGRLPFDNTADLQKIVNKTLRYEKTPTATTGGSKPNWYKGGGCFAGSGSGISPCQTMRTVRARMMDAGFPSTSIDTVYWTDVSFGPTEMNASINSGVSLWCYRGYLGMSGYGTGNVSSLNNVGRWPYILNLTCGTNDYNGSSYDLCEALLLGGTVSSPTGAVAICGMSSIHTNTRYNNCLMSGAVQGMMTEGIHSTGGALRRAKLEVYRSYPADSSVGRVTFFMGITTLLGDPAIDVFNDTPDTLYVNNPATLSTGANTLTLTVTEATNQPVPGAYVNLLKGTEVFVGDWTNASGQVTLNFTTSSVDTLFITATKHNCRPAANYALVTNAAQYVAPPTSNFSLNDDNIAPSQGNGDGLANPGETLELSLPLKNWGSAAVTGVSASLSISDPYVTLTPGAQNYGTISPGATVSPAAPFVFSLSNYVPDGRTLQFTLTVTDDAAHTWTNAIPIRAANGALQLVSSTLQNVGNGILDPGESGQLYLTLVNAGRAATLANTVGYLRSGSLAVLVTDSVGSFTAATVNGQCNNSGNTFSLTATTDAYPGERIPFQCIFPLANGFSDTVNFSLVMGSVASSSPTPPDAYGYWAFDNTDVNFAKHPTYNWVEIDPRSGGAGTVVPITDAADEADTTVVVDLPFAFRYYGQAFTQIAVCSNGWLAMGADNSPFTDFRNYAIPSALGPSRMIAPFWDDLRIPPSTTLTDGRGEVHALDQGSDNCPATVIPSVPYTDAGTTAGQANNFTTSSCSVGGAPDVIYQWTPTATGSYVVSLCGSSYDTGLMIRTGGSCPGSSEVSCNDDFCSYQSQITQAMTAGTTYYIIVDGYGTSSGAYTLSVTAFVPPSPAGVYSYYDATNHRYILEWSHVQKYNGSAPYPDETFECILYEAGYPATPTGDGEILFQYLTCNNTTDAYSSNDYCTVGIENLNNTDGVQYSYWNQVSPAIPGAAALTGGRAILFTTAKYPSSTPQSPVNLVVYNAAPDVVLLWNAVHSDVHGIPLPSVQYRVYRGNDAGFVPGAGSYLATVSDTSYTDVAPGSQRYFYIVQAESPAGNAASPIESMVSPPSATTADRPGPVKRER
ncbi:MAG TPA: C25 family cysteine peptidase [bacterium]|jgi:hypothetical protein